MAVQIAGLGLTPTERKMYELLLEDSCSEQTLFACLDDELSGKTAVKWHVSNLRKKIASTGHDIVFRNGFYHLMRRVRSS